MTGKAETRLRGPIAAATRLLNAEGIRGYSGHVSAWTSRVLVAEVRAKFPGVFG